MRKLILILAVFMLLPCSVYAGDTWPFTSKTDINQVVVSDIFQYGDPINALATAINFDSSDTKARIDSGMIEDSAVTTLEIADNTITNTDINSSANIGYTKLQRNPYMPYARDLQYDSPTVDTTVFQNARIQWGYAVLQGSDTYYMSGSITYPTAYDTSFIVVPLAQLAGYNTASDSYSTSAEAQDEKITIYAPTTTGFSYGIRNTAGSTMSSSNYYFIVWWALGRKD